MHSYHELDPVYTSDSRILILGSFPSVKSRESGFYYAHKSNRFWPIMSFLFSEPLTSVDEKKRFLNEKGIALWDVVGECDISASSDSSIKDVKANDIGLIIKSAKIEKIFLNGGTAYNLFCRYLKDGIAISYEKLPSTSSANAGYSFDRLLESWKAVKDALFLFDE